jgi:hypothetical protein
MGNTSRFLRKMPYDDAHFTTGGQHLFTYAALPCSDTFFKMNAPTSVVAVQQLT